MTRRHLQPTNRPMVRLRQVRWSIAVPTSTSTIQRRRCRLLIWAGAVRSRPIGEAAGGSAAAKSKSRRPDRHLSPLPRASPMSCGYPSGCRSEPRHLAAVAARCISGGRAGRSPEVARMAFGAGEIKGVIGAALDGTASATSGKNEIRPSHVSAGASATAAGAGMTDLIGSDLRPDAVQDGRSATTGETPEVKDFTSDQEVRWCQGATLRHPQHHPQTSCRVGPAAGEHRVRQRDPVAPTGFLLPGTYGSLHPRARSDHRDGSVTRSSRSVGVGGHRRRRRCPSAATT